MKTLLISMLACGIALAQTARRGAAKEAAARRQESRAGGRRPIC